MTSRSFTAALAALALLPRLYVAIAWTREPVWDGHYYHLGARGIAEGIGYAARAGFPWCHYPVGYSGLLGLSYRLFGSGLLVAPIINAALGTLLAVLVYRLTRYVTSESRARVAGLLTALQPGLIIYSALLMTEVTAALALIAAALIAVRYRGSRNGSVLAGLVLGLGTLVRPQSILLAPAIGFFIHAYAKGADRNKRAIKAAVLCTVTALAVVSPWTLRNCRVMDGCAFVSTNGGWNMAIGSSPRATGRFHSLRASDGCRVVTGQVQQDRCWMQLGLSWIKAAPLRWLALMPQKLAHTFDHESFAISYLAEADPDSWPAEKQKLGRRILSMSYQFLLCLAPLGFIAWSRRRKLVNGVALIGYAVLLYRALALDHHPFWPFALFIPVLASLMPTMNAGRRPVLNFLAYGIATVCLVHMIFFGEDRYHLVVTPLLCVLAASALRPSSSKCAAP